MTKEFSSLLIDEKATIIDAMRQLDKTAEKILFVTEKDNRLVGSLTDGDIRRWILNDGHLNSLVKEACYKETFWAPIKYNLDFVKQEMLRRKIVYVPVLNEDGNIIEFLVWDKLFNDKIVHKTKEKLSLPVVIMAGGKGTRLEPFTKILPKPLIPIGDKTILEMIIEKFLDFQLKHFYISLNHKARIIKSYFEELQPSYEITYLYEDKPLGTVGSLKQLQGKINGNILLTNCDIITDIDLSDLVKLHTEQKNNITMVVSLKRYNLPYGICEIENGGILKSLQEKPGFNFLINTGMYVLGADMLQYIPQDELFHMTHLIEKAKDDGKRVGVYPISENSWTDTGEWIEYQKAISKLKIV